MKRKFAIIILTALVLASCFLFFAPVDFGVKKQISIHAPITDVVNQITNLHNWPHWKNGLKNQDTSLFQVSTTSTNINSFLRFRDKQYTILKDNAASVTVRENIGNVNAAFHTIFAFPDSFGTATTIQWIKNVSVFSWLIEKLKSSGEIEGDLKSLKNYMENPIAYYGYPIEVKKVTDSLVMTKKTIGLTKNKNATLSQLYKNIIDYASSNNIEINKNNPRMANFYEINKDSIQIMVGIDVSRKAPDRNNISYLEMPSHGRMLVGYYEGDYAGLKNLYRAMDKYVFDKHLHVIASPYEKYLSNPESSNDSLHMKIELYYPIL